jgi:hypothetical protein
MTLVAVDAVVHISRHVLMTEVRRVVVSVATSALEHGVVIGIRMARRTDIVRVAVTR